MRSQEPGSERRRIVWVDDYREERRHFAIAARVLALLWAGVWMHFSLVTGYRAHMGLAETLRDSWQYGPVSLGVALIALGWDTLGGVLLVVVGVAWGIHLLPWLEVGDLLLQVEPPLVAGIMLLLSSQKPKEKAT